MRSFSFVLLLVALSSASACKYFCRTPGTFQYECCDDGNPYFEEGEASEVPEVEGTETEGDADEATDVTEQESNSQASSNCFYYCAYDGEVYCCGDTSQPSEYNASDSKPLSVVSVKLPERSKLDLKVSTLPKMTSTNDSTGPIPNYLRLPLHLLRRPPSAPISNSVPADPPDRRKFVQKASAGLDRQTSTETGDSEEESGSIFSPLSSLLSFMDFSAMDFPDVNLPSMEFPPIFSGFYSSTPEPTDMTLAPSAPVTANPTVKPDGPTSQSLVGNDKDSTLDKRQVEPHDSDEQSSLWLPILTDSPSLSEVYRTKPASLDNLPHGTIITVHRPSTFLSSLAAGVPIILDDTTQVKSTDLLINYVTPHHALPHATHLPHAHLPTAHQHESVIINEPAHASAPLVSPHKIHPAIHHPTPSHPIVNPNPHSESFLSPSVDHTLSHNAIYSPGSQLTDPSHIGNIHTADHSIPYNSPYHSVSPYPHIKPVHAPTPVTIGPIPAEPMSYDMLPPSYDMVPPPPVYEFPVQPPQPDFNVEELDELLNSIFCECEVDANGNSDEDCGCSEYEDLVLVFPPKPLEPYIFVPLSALGNKHPSEPIPPVIYKDKAIPVHIPSVTNDLSHPKPQYEAPISYEAPSIEITEPESAYESPGPAYEVPSSVEDSVEDEVAIPAAVPVTQSYLPPVIKQLIRIPGSTKMALKDAKSPISPPALIKPAQPVLQLYNAPAPLSDVKPIQQAYEAPKPIQVYQALKQKYEAPKLIQQVYESPKPLQIAYELHKPFQQAYEPQSYAAPKPIQQTYGQPAIEHTFALPNAFPSPPAHAVKTASIPGSLPPPTFTQSFTPSFPEQPAPVFIPQVESLDSDSEEDSSKELSSPEISSQEALPLGIPSQQVFSEEAVGNSFFPNPIANLFIQDTPSSEILSIETKSLESLLDEDDLTFPVNHDIQSQSFAPAVGFSQGFGLPQSGFLVPASHSFQSQGIVLSNTAPQSSHLAQVPHSSAHQLSNPITDVAPNFLVMSAPSFISNQASNSFTQPATNTFHQPATNAFHKTAVNTFQQPVTNTLQQTSADSTVTSPINAFQQSPISISQQPITNALQATAPDSVAFSSVSTGHSQTGILPTQPQSFLPQHQSVSLSSGHPLSSTSSQEPSSSSSNRPSSSLGQRLSLASLLASSSLSSIQNSLSSPHSTHLSFSSRSSSTSAESPSPSSSKDLSPSSSESLPSTTFKIPSPSSSSSSFES